jgi:hypothetical protein
MAVDWGQMAQTLFQGKTWEESVAIWKVSNVLGWSMSTIAGWYMCNYGAIKTQLMVGFERKINMLYKYEWYMTKPTKVLLNGEGKIDLEKISKTTPWYNHAGLMFTSLGSTHTVETLEKDVKAAAEVKRVTGGTTETHGTHTMTVTLGNSTESIALGNKNIMATTVIVDAKTGIALSAGAGSVAISSASVTVSGPVINLG